MGLGGGWAGPVCSLQSTVGALGGLLGNPDERVQRSPQEEVEFENAKTKRLALMAQIHTMYTHTHTHTHTHTPQYKYTPYTYTHIILSIKGTWLICTLLKILTLHFLMTHFSACTCSSILKCQSVNTKMPRYVPSLLWLFHDHSMISSSMASISAG